MPPCHRRHSASSRLVMQALCALVMSCANMALSSETEHTPAAAAPGTETVLCLGASQVQGDMSYNWVADLGKEYGPHLRFVNQGHNGELAVNVLRRSALLVSSLPCWLSCTLVHEKHMDVHGVGHRKAPRFTQLCRTDLIMLLNSIHTSATPVCTLE